MYGSIRPARLNTQKATTTPHRSFFDIVFGPPCPRFLLYTIGDWVLIASRCNIYCRIESFVPFVPRRRIRPGSNRKPSGRSSRTSPHFTTL